MEEAVEGRRVGGRESYTVGGWAPDLRESWYRDSCGYSGGGVAVRVEGLMEVVGPGIEGKGGGGVVSKY